MNWLSNRVAQFERRCIIRVLQRVKGNVAAAAKICGRNRTDFYKLLYRHDIHPALYRPIKVTVVSEQNRPLYIGLTR